MKLWENNEYRIMTEDGETIITYEDLLRSPLIELIRQSIPTYGIMSREGLILGRTIITFDRKYVKQNKKANDVLDDYHAAQLENPLQFFAPSGMGALNFINDRTSRICFLKAPNQVGKTTSTVIKRLLIMAETNPSWPIFEEHGVNPVQHLAEMGGCASYKWEHIREVLAPELFRWMPLWEYPSMVPQWRGGEGEARSWQDRPSIRLANGAGLRYHAYKQSQSSFESAVLRAGWDWDEQPELERWKGANERIRTSRTAQHNHCLTPHQLDDSEYVTGAGTFLEAIWEGTDLMGYTASQVKRYEISRMNPEWDPGDDRKKGEKILKAMEGGEIFPAGDVPDWIVPEQSKVESYRELVNSLIKRDKKLTRKLHSRVFGSFESSESKLIPEYDEAFHVIDPFKVPLARCTLYRYIDPGRNAPCACIWGAVPEPGVSLMINDKLVEFPEDENVIIFFREYYEPGRTIEPNAHGIIEASGNRVKRAGQLVKGNQVYQRYEENFIKEVYYRCKGDTGALGKAPEDSEMTVQDLYRIRGLKMQKATRMRLKESADIVREWFAVNESRPHPFYDKKGFSKAYIFSGLVNLRRELRDLIDPAEWGKRRPQADHLYDCMRYCIIDGPRYVEGHSLHTDFEEELDKSDEVQYAIPRDNITGY